MSQIDIILYKEEDGTVPVSEWLARLPAKPREKSLAKIRRLRALGHELRRPEADYLGDDIYELRIKFGHINYRILYFFHGRTAAILSHAIVKERRVPSNEIDKAIARRRKFIFAPVEYSARMEI